MKPIYLEFSGLNSFAEKATVDFSVLLGGGIFGIFGDTGSGKSTILDSIHFALYGVVDRVRRSFNDCINLHSDGVSVLFDFEIVYQGARKVFRVKRERKRKANSTKAWLYERADDGKFMALAEGASEVDRRVEEIIGLSFDDFKTCIALPQGDFDALVHSQPAERVKLMARLFNLEKYGERLAVAVNSKHAQAKNALDVLLAQMGENEGADEEKLCQARLEVEESEGLVRIARAEAENCASAYTQALQLQTEKRAFDEAQAKLRALENRLTDMQAQKALLQRLPSARAVADAYVAWTREEKRYESAKQALAQAKAHLAECVKKTKIAKTAKAQSDVQERIVQANVDLAKIRESAQDIEYERKCRRDLEECKKAFRECKYDGEAEDFEKNRAEIESRLSALGEDEDLLGYLKRNLKGVMLTETYGEIRKDLRALETKYPQTGGDIATLLAKYTLQNQTAFSAEDVTNAQLAFKQVEQERKRLKTQLESLEKRYLAYLKWTQELQTITERGKLLKQAHALALDKIAGVSALGTAEEAGLRLRRLQAEQEGLEKALENATRAENDAVAKCKQWDGVLLEYETHKAERKTAFLDILERYGYADEKEANALLARIGDEEKTSRETEKFFEEYALYKTKVAETDERKFAKLTDESVAILRGKKTVAEENSRAETVRLGARQEHLKRLTVARERYKAQEKELLEKQKTEKLYDELKQLVRNNKFLEFIAAEYLQEICQTASKTLLSLTGGRYFLKYTEKEFKVGDNLNGGTLRVVKTLSGGETFLVSLALALSLSGAICAQSQRPIEFFFLDEGFGTLDERLVDTVMDVLGKLSQSFSVGLISHVEELKRRIEYKAVVTGATETHGSTVRIETF